MLGQIEFLKDQPGKAHFVVGKCEHGHKTYQTQEGLDEIYKNSLLHKPKLTLSDRAATFWRKHRPRIVFGDTARDMEKNRLNI